MKKKPIIWREIDPRNVVFEFVDGEITKATEIVDPETQAINDKRERFLQALFSRMTPKTPTEKTIEKAVEEDDGWTFKVVKE